MDIGRLPNPASAGAKCMRRTLIRVVDTGLNSAAVNIALDRRWLAGHVRGERDNLLRFYRSTPSAWLGLHQWPERELRLLYCRRKGIEVVRRPTGGGALYVDPQQLGFSLILKLGERLLALGEAGIVRQGCEAVVDALRGFGLCATFKAPNDVEVQGRKLASLFMCRQRGTVLLQGLLLLNADVGRVLGALRLPTEPAVGSAGPIAAGERLTALDRLYARPPSPARLRKALVAALAMQFNLRAQSSTKTVYAQLRGPSAAAPWPAGLEQIQVPTATLHWRGHALEMADVAETLWHTPGGLLRARLRWDPLQHAPRWLEVGGSVQVQPLDLFMRLGQSLTGVTRAQLAERLHSLCGQAKARLIGFSHADLFAALVSAWDRADQQRDFGLSVEQSNRLTPICADGPAVPAVSLMRRTDTLLVPYCARPPECRGRALDECRVCTRCEVGSACRTADEHGLKVREMTHYADLAGLLGQLRAEGSTGVVGMTCRTFFIKHHEVFTGAGLPMLLVDLGGTTCYELQQEAAGYSGRFPYQTRLDVQLLRKLMQKPVTEPREPLASRVG
jgi:lipoate---protein ligase